MANQDRYWAYFDEAWKKIIERFFPQLLQFFVPNLYEDVDFSKEITFLDKEMEQLSIRSMKGAKYVDKLARVYLKDGSEEWILVHIEVQGYPDKEFSLRMFRYFYKIFDRHGKEIGGGEENAIRHKRRENRNEERITAGIFGRR